MNLLLVLCMLIPEPDPVLEADRVELNTVLTENGNESLTQWIIWEWNEAMGRFIVMDYCIYVGQGTMFPSNGMWRGIIGPAGKCIWRVKTHDFIRTMSIGDREVDNRKYVPLELRKGVFRFEQRSDWEW